MKSTTSIFIADLAPALECAINRTETNAVNDARNLSLENPDDDAVNINSLIRIGRNLQQCHKDRMTVRKLDRIVKRYIY